MSMGLTIPALTAASPSINPPSIDIDEALVEDILISHSFNISKHIIINIASIYAGNGTKLLPAFSISNRYIGTKS